MTSLTLYGTQSASSLATACKLVTITGGVSASKTTKVGTIQGSGELFSLGSTATFPGTTVSASAGVHGYLWDVNTLELQTIASGTWTVKVNLNWNATYTTMSSTITARVWKRSSAGVYTKIGSDMTVAGPGASTTAQTLFTLTGSSFASMDFGLGDQLYLDVWLTVTSTGGATTRTIALWASSSATTGIAGQVEIDTPGYAPTPGLTNLVLYGSDVADSTLTTACQMAATSGGTETSKVTAGSSGTGNFLEVTSQGNAAAVVVSAISAPTGNGWVYQPGAGTFAAGNWSATGTFAKFGGNSAWTMRFYQYTGSYTLIGTLTATPTTSTKSVYAFSAVSMGAAVFGASDLLYIDLWFQDATGAGGDSATVYESTSSTAGVSSDMQITTSAFTASGAALSAECDGVGTLSATFSLATALTAECDGVGTLAGTLSTSSGGVTLAVTMAGAGTLAGTVQLSTSLAVTIAGIGTLAGTLQETTALSQTMAGTGTLTPTLSFATSLTTTIAGIGTLTAATPTLTTALSASIPGTGTLAGTVTLKTALSVTMAGVGTLAPTLSASLALPTTTIPGVGTLSGTLSLSTALTVSLSGVGTLAGTLGTTGGGSASLSVTCAGAGTLSGTLTTHTALSTTVAGIGVLTGMLSAQTALSGQFSGAGTLSGTPAYAVMLSVSMSGTGVLTGVAGLRVALSLLCAAMGTLSGTVTLTGTLVSLPGIALVSDALRGQAALGDRAVATATTSDMLAGQATAGDALIDQATASDVATGNVLLSDQG